MCRFTARDYTWISLIEHLWHRDIRRAVCRLLLFAYAPCKLRERPINIRRKTSKTGTRALKSIQIRPVNSSSRNIVWYIDSMTNAHQWGINNFIMYSTSIRAGNKSLPAELWWICKSCPGASMFSRRAMQKVTSTNKWNQKSLHCHILLPYHGIRQLIIALSRTVRDSPPVTITNE